MSKKTSSHHTNAINSVHTLWRSLLDEPKNKKYFVASMLLHVVVIFLLLFSWESSKELKILKVPNSIQAHVLSLEEIQMLQKMKQAEQKKLSDSKKKKKDLKRKKLEDKKKKLKLKKKKEADKKKAAKRKADQAEKIRIKKKKQKQKAQQQKKQLEQEKNEKAALAKQKQAEDKRTAREQRLLDKLKLLEAHELKQLELLEKAKNAEVLSQQKADKDFELSEVERFILLIRAKIESRWHIPPKLKGKGLSFDLRINLLPTGELVSARVIKSSGKIALDQSAENAAISVRRYPVPEGSAIFEGNFRQFTLRFSP